MNEMSLEETGRWLCEDKTRVAIAPGSRELYAKMSGGTLRWCRKDGTAVGKYSVHITPYLLSGWKKCEPAADEGGKCQERDQEFPRYFALYKGGRPQRYADCAYVMYTDTGRGILVGTDGQPIRKGGTTLKVRLKECRLGHTVEVTEAEAEALRAVYHYKLLSLSGESPFAMFWGGTTLSYPVNEWVDGGEKGIYIGTSPARLWAGSAADEAKVLPLRLCIVECRGEKQNTRGGTPGRYERVRRLPPEEAAQVLDSMPYTPDEARTYGRDQGRHDGLYYDWDESAEGSWAWARAKMHEGACVKDERRVPHRIRGGVVQYLSGGKTWVALRNLTIPELEGPWFVCDDPSAEPEPPETPSEPERCEWPVEKRSEFLELCVRDHSGGLWGLGSVTGCRVDGEWWVLEGWRHKADNKLHTLPVMWQSPVTNFLRYTAASKGAVPSIAECAVMRRVEMEPDDA